MSPKSASLQAVHSVEKRPKHRICICIFVYECIFVYGKFKVCQYTIFIYESAEWIRFLIQRTNKIEAKLDISTTVKQVLLLF